MSPYRTRSGSRCGNRSPSDSEPWCTASPWSTFGSGPPIGTRLGRSWGSGTTRSSIGTVGNLREQKRYPDLLEAARSVVDAEASVRFAAAGAGADDPSGAAIVRRHADLGLGDDFRFLGYVEDTARFLSACDVFVLASGFEGLAVSMMEALALGLPVVATAVPGIEGEIRDGKEGLLVPVGRPELLAEAILTLVRDPERRNRMAQEARAGADRFDIVTAVRDIEALYRRITRRGSAEPVPQQPERTHR